MGACMRGFGDVSRGFQSHHSASMVEPSWYQQHAWTETAFQIPAWGRKRLKSETNTDEKGENEETEASVSRERYRSRKGCSD